MRDAPNRRHGRFVGVLCAAAALFAALASAAAAATTLGTTTVGGGPGLAGTDTTGYGNIYTLGASGTVTSVSVYILDSSVSQSFTPIIYAASGGTPGALVTQGSQTTITPGTTGWVTVSVTPASLAPGDYLVGLLFAHTSDGFHIADTGFGTGQSLDAATMSSDSNPDDPWPGGATYQDTLSVYASLTSHKGTKAKPAGPPQVNDVFLCYSKFQSDPGVWDTAIAASLLASGYWLPYAVPGNVDGATNIGDDHLICNLAVGQQANGGFVDGSGEAWSPDFAGMVGLYPTAG